MKNANNKNSDKLTESLEKYLLAIYEITKTNTAARVKDVSNYLNIGGPATSDAVKTLAARGFINYVPYGIITMTQKGLKKAEGKMGRHAAIKNFLEKVLMVEKNRVEDGAKSIEYSMPEDILEKFVTFLNFMENCSCSEPKWANSYKFLLKHGEMSQKCGVCKKNKEEDKKIFVCSGCCWADEKGIQR